MLSTKLYDINGFSTNQTITASVDVHVRNGMGRWKGKTVTIWKLR
jgi:hypothetical protein